LRGVTLSGIDSVMRPRADRLEAWRRLSQDLDMARLDRLTEEIPLGHVIERAAHFHGGQVRGRLVVDVNR
jgi:acrylyl-CoA reductase (NADPH)